jgi:integrase
MSPTMRPQKTKDGWYVYAKVHVPKLYISIVGNKQLVKSGTIPFDKFPTLEDAKKEQLNWIKQLKKKASGKGLTYATYANLYRDQAGKHAQGSIVNRLTKELGKKEMSESIEGHFEEFIDIVKSEKVKRYKAQYRFNCPVCSDIGKSAHKRTDHARHFLCDKCGSTAEIIEKKVVLSDTENKISDSTIQAYKRYHKAIVNFSKGSECPKEIRIKSDAISTKSIKVGRAKKRKRPVEEWERTKYLQAAKELDKGFYWAVQFSRSMPIRPEDLVDLKTEQVGSDWHIPYCPKKTHGRTGKVARPRILMHMRDYVVDRRQDRGCPWLFYSNGIGRIGEKPDKKYQLTYSRLDNFHNTICRRTGITDLHFYDWKHDSVNYLRSLGFTQKNIMDFAGWTTECEVNDYDTDDENRLSDVCDIIEKEAFEKMENIVIKFKKQS